MSQHRVWDAGKRRSALLKIRLMEAEEEMKKPEGERRFETSVERVCREMALMTDPKVKRSLEWHLGETKTYGKPVAVKPRAK